MEAHFIRIALLLALIPALMGAKVQTANFVVEAQDVATAQQCAVAAEKLRADLAKEWLGHTMPNWYRRCPLKVRVGQHLSATAATTFTFDRGEVFGWHMTVQGPRERVLDSVLPHEITHMILASHFRRPIPRWADEGAATSVEHPSEKQKYRQLLFQLYQTGRAISLANLFGLTEYPNDATALYAQGHSVSDYLIQLRGRRAFVKFLDDAFRTGNWSQALRQNYEVESVDRLQVAWTGWTRQGCPSLRPQTVEPGPSPTLIAAAGTLRDEAAMAPSATPAPRAPNGPASVARPAEDLSPIAKNGSVPTDLVMRIDKDHQLASMRPSANTLRDDRRLVPVVLPPRLLATASPGADVPPGYVIPAGWHPVGTPAPSRPMAARPDNIAAGEQQRPFDPAASPHDYPSAGPSSPAGRISTQVTHPQPVHGMGHVILNWTRQ